MVWRIFLVWLVWAVAEVAATYTLDGTFAAADFKGKGVRKEKKDKHAEVKKVWQRLPLIARRHDLRQQLVALAEKKQQIENRITELDEFWEWREAKKPQKPSVVEIERAAHVKKMAQIKKGLFNVEYVLCRVQSDLEDVQRKIKTDPDFCSDRKNLFCKYFDDPHFEKLRVKPPTPVTIVTNPIQYRPERFKGNRASILKGSSWRVGGV